MRQMTFLDLCSGIGGFRLGLERAGHKCIGYCEYDKFARASYEAMYDTEGEWKSDDVTKLKSEDVPDADIWCFGFPCQDISVAGKQRGLVGKRSRIYTAGISNHRAANSAVMEVRPVITPERMEKRQNGRRMKEDGEPMFTLTSQDRHGVYLCEKTDRPCDSLKVKNATKAGYEEAHIGDSINLTYPDSNTRRGRVGKGCSQTLDCSGQMGTLMRGGRIRRLTPKECFRLQGFPDALYEKAAAVNSDAQLYKQAGNAVTATVAYAIAMSLPESREPDIS